MDITAAQAMIQSKNPPLTILLVLLLLSLLNCTDKPTKPELTEEDVARIVAEELLKWLMLQV